MMNQFMVDIETMGTAPYSVIMSIGIVQFDIKTGETGAEFYRTIDLESSKKIGLLMDSATIDWWKKQDPKIYKKMLVNTKPVQTVLKELTEWLKKNCRTSKYMWGNSARFDLGLLECAYIKAGLEIPWAWWNERCCRTIVALNDKIKNSMEKPKDAHDPITDCHYQINYVVKTIQSL